MDHQSYITDQVTLPKKRNSCDADVYLSADEQVDIHNLINGRESSYVFPRDDQLNYICIFQGCNKPILRGLGTNDYLSHLREHVTSSDRLLSSMLRRVKDEDGTKRRRANSCNTYNLNMLPKRTRELDSPFAKEDPIGSPESPSDSPPTPRKRAHSTDEYNIPLKPSSRGVQLRDQMLRYGLHLFRIDSEGKYICFFDECSLHMMTNFSRHIAKHEKNGDKIKQELLHLCSPSIVQQQLQQHPNLYLPLSHSLHPHNGPPLQQLLLRHQQESIQVQQQQQQQQQLTLQTSPHQLEQIQAFHTMQLQQVQLQHQQQLQMLQRNLSYPSPPHSPLQQMSSPASHLLSSQEMHKQQQPTQIVPELSLSTVQNETDLALMRTQISKMLEESSSRRPVLKQRSLSLAYSSSSPPFSSHPAYTAPSPTIAPQNAVPPYSPFKRNTFPSSEASSPSTTPLSRSLSISPDTPAPSPSTSFSTTASFSSTSSSTSPSSSASSDIQWIFSSKTKPVLTK